MTKQDPAWVAYRRQLNKAGYRADVTDSWRHKETGRRIYPHEFKPQSDGSRRVNWRYWAEYGAVPHEDGVTLVFDDPVEMLRSRTASL